MERRGPLAYGPLALAGLAVSSALYWSNNDHAHAIGGIVLLVFGFAAPFAVLFSVWAAVIALEDFGKWLRSLGSRTSREARLSGGGYDDVHARIEARLSEQGNAERAKGSLEETALLAELPIGPGDRVSYTFPRRDGSSYTRYGVVVGESGGVEAHVKWDGGETHVMQCADLTRTSINAGSTD